MPCACKHTTSELHDLKIMFPASFQNRNLEQGEFNGVFAFSYYGGF